MMIQALPHYPAASGGGGAEVGFVGGKSSAYDGTGSTVNVSLTDLAGGTDSAPATGDLVIVSFAHANQNSDVDMTCSSGFTEQFETYRDDSIDLNFAVYTKVMGGSPDTSITVSASDAVTNAIVRVLVFRGVDTTTPMDVTVTTQSAIDTGAAVIPAITPVTTGAIVVGTAAACAGNALNVFASMDNPGGYTPFLSSKQSKLVSCIGAIEWAGGAVGPFSVNGATGSVACYASLHMALRPA